MPVGGLQDTEARTGWVTDLENVVEEVRRTDAR